MRLLLWSSIFLPQTKKSSISVSTPFKSLKFPFMILWNTSCAECIPKGSLINLYLPNRVFIVVNLVLSSSKGICQYPFVASNFMKWVAPANLVEISSNAGSWKCSLFMDLFKSQGSRHNRSEPSGFSTTTNEFTHSIGSSTSSLCNSISLHFVQFLPHFTPQWYWNLPRCIDN